MTPKKPLAHYATFLPVRNFDEPLLIDSVDIKISEDNFEMLGNCSLGEVKKFKAIRGEYEVEQELVLTCIHNRMDGVVQTWGACRSIFKINKNELQDK